MIEIKLTSHKDEVLAAMESARERALEAIGIKAEKYAKALAPVGTPESTGKKGYRGGTLRRSIGHGHDDHSAWIGTNVEYAIFQELGTRYMRAANKGRGYLRPAVTDHIDEYRNIVKSELKKG